MSYKTALRAKGIKPIPPYERLRSAKSGDTVIGDVREIAEAWRRPIKQGTSR